MTDFREKVAAWRALPEAEKTRLRRGSAVDQVVGSMRMEGEPISAEQEAALRKLIDENAT